MSVHYNDVKRSNRLKAIRSSKQKSTNVKSIRLLTPKLLTSDLSKSLYLMFTFAASKNNAHSYITLKSILDRVFRLSY